MPQSGPDGTPSASAFSGKKGRIDLYGGTLDEFLASVRRLLGVEADAWLSAHPGQSRTFEKLARLRAGERPNPFIDPAGWKDYLAGRIEAAEKLLNERK